MHQGRLNERKWAPIPCPLFERMRGESGHELLPVVPVAGLGLPGLEPV